MDTATVAPRGALERRRDVDLAAFAEARSTAQLEATRLLSLLSGTGAAAELEFQAKRTLDAVGLLWESAARLNQH